MGIVLLGISRGLELSSRIAMPLLFVLLLQAPARRVVSEQDGLSPLRLPLAESSSVSHQASQHDPNNSQTKACSARGMVLILLQLR